LVDLSVIGRSLRAKGRVSELEGSEKKLPKLKHKGHAIDPPSKEKTKKGHSGDLGWYQMV
jgi:hypothetical protein